MNSDPRPCHGHGGPSCMESPCSVCGRVVPTCAPVEDPIPEGLSLAEAIRWCAEKMTREMREQLEK